MKNATYLLLLRLMMMLCLKFDRVIIVVSSVLFLDRVRCTASPVKYIVLYVVLITVN
jgi:hypothetical protein